MTMFSYNNIMMITWKELGLGCLNGAFVAICYVLVGVFLSFVLHYLFNTFDDQWKSTPCWYKFLDVSLEVSIIAIVAVLSARFFTLAPPLFKVRPILDKLIDSYISGNFFIFAMFIFMDDLTQKLKFVYIEVFGDNFDKYLDSTGLLHNFLKTN